MVTGNNGSATTGHLLELDHYTDESNAWQFQGFALTTHRVTGAQEGSIEFPYQLVAAAIAVMFFRTTVHASSEPRGLRYFFAVLLASLTLARKSYELILAVEIFSYTFVVLAMLQKRDSLWLERIMYGSAGLFAAATLSYGLAHALVTGLLLEYLTAITPTIVIRGLYYLIPVQECVDAYEMLQSIALPSELLPKQVAHLLFVTFHIQTGMGFLGIHFLKKEQERRNLLIRMDVADEEENNANAAQDSKGKNRSKNASKESKDAAKLARSRRFQRTAVPFIFRTALPYMLQIIAYGNLNFYCFHCLSHDLHRTVRWHQTLAQDSHWMAMTQTPVSPEGKSGRGFLLRLHL